MKFIRVNMTDQTIQIEKVPEKYLGLGGRGLTSIMVNDEVPPTCDPLGEQNKLVFAPGFLSGTTLVNTSRISVGAKSPLTGGIKESNAGGTIKSNQCQVRHPARTARHPGHGNSRAHGRTGF